MIVHQGFSERIMKQNLKWNAERQRRSSLMPWLRGLRRGGDLCCLIKNRSLGVGTEWFHRILPLNPSLCTIYFFLFICLFQAAFKSVGAEVFFMESSWNSVWHKPANHQILDGKMNKEGYSRRRAVILLLDQRERDRNRSEIDLCK